MIKITKDMAGKVNPSNPLNPVNWIRAIVSFPFALIFFNLNWREATWEFRELFAGLSGINDKNS